MIISDINEFFFIHIPKCAGTYVRSAIQKIDPHAININYVAKHAELGELDFTHIPLRQLYDYFPLEWQKILHYNTFACIRDPFKRFPSSLAQRLRQCKGHEIKSLTKRQLSLEVGEVIQKLSKAPHDSLLSADMIHFQKQVDYIFLNQQQIIKTVLDVNQVESYLAELFAFSESHTRSKLPSGYKLNETFGYKNELYRILDLYVIEPIYHHRIGRYHRIRPRLSQFKEWVQIPYSDQIDPIFYSDTVLEFIRTYYRDDINYLEEVSKKNLEYINNHVL